MSREFSNIIIFNNNTIDFIAEKLEKMIIDLEYTKCEKDEAKIKIDIIQDDQNNICLVSSKYFAFSDLATNKSLIRKIAKRVAQDTFMVSSKEDVAVVEKYSFNKRIYDYIALGDESKLDELGYNESYAMYMEPIVWSNHFVGRNTLADLNKILEQRKTYFENYEVLVDMLKLYGIKFELVTYNYNVSSEVNGTVKRELFFK